MLAFVIALFLWTGATAAIVVGQAAPPAARAWSRATLARRTLAVPDDLPLAEAVRRAQEAEAGSIVTVTAAGDPVGIVNEAALARDPRGAPALGAGLRWPAPSRPGWRCRPTSRGEELILAISRTPAARVPPASRPTARSTACSSTADVDRAFRGRAH